MVNTRVLKDDIQLEKSLRAIERRFSVSLTLHDIHGRLYDSMASPLLPNRHVHHHECCLRGRYSIPGWEKRCFRDCFYEIEGKIEKQSAIVLKECWKGLIELVIPVFRNNVHELTIFAGVWKGQNHAAEDMPVWFRKRYAALPAYNRKIGSELAGILHFTGLGMLEYANQFSDISAPMSARLKIIREFISQNAHKNIHVRDLAAVLYLSESRTKSIVKATTGFNFVELLTAERMRQAKYLVTGTDLDLSKIAEIVGFRNEFYFNTVFSKYYNESPGMYRKRHPQEDTSC